MLCPIVTLASKAQGDAGALWNTPGLWLRLASGTFASVAPCMKILRLLLACNRSQGGCSKLPNLLQHHHDGRVDLSQSFVEWHMGSVQATGTVLNKVCIL